MPQRIFILKPPIADQNSTSCSCKYSNFTPSHFNSHSLQKPRFPPASAKATTNETLSEILDSSRAQKLDLELKTLGPFFRITARSLVTDKELGKAEGFIRFWVGGKILHLDSIKLQRETLGMEKSIFGLGLFIGAVAIRHGYDSGCKTAQLLAINDSDLYHSKVLFSPTLSKTSHLLFIFGQPHRLYFNDKS